MKKFGIRTDGIEIEIEEIFKNYLRDNNHNFKYYEIGCAGCITLKAITDIVEENIKHSDWLIEGIDLSKESSINLQEINSVFSAQTLQVFDNGLSNINYLNIPKTRLLLWNDPRKYTKSLLDESLDIVLIDGNHNEINVTEDFLSVESKIKKNGLVLFHDFCELEQGTDPQAGGGFIEVRKACENLNLMNNKRDGWLFIKEIKGSRYWGGDGNGVGIFKKLNDFRK
jgi:hypothetical protein